MSRPWIPRPKSSKSWLYVYLLLIFIICNLFWISIWVVFRTSKRTQHICRTRPYDRGSGESLAFTHVNQDCGPIISCFQTSLWLFLHFLGKGVIFDFENGFRTILWKAYPYSSHNKVTNLVITFSHQGNQPWSRANPPVAEASLYRDILTLHSIRREEPLAPSVPKLRSHPYKLVHLIS